MNFIYEEKYGAKYPLVLNTFEGLRQSLEDGEFSDSTEH
jgi:hypothetical protein